MNPCRGLAASRTARASHAPGAACRREVLRVLGPALALAVARPGAAEPARRIALVLEAGRLRPGPELTPARGAPTLRLRQGETVELHWSSDRPVVLHLHGYGIEAQAAPGSPATMRLAARVAGRFAVETHRADGRHAALLYLEVHPR